MLAADIVAVQKVEEGVFLPTMSGFSVIFTNCSNLINNLLTSYIEFDYMPFGMNFFFVCNFQ